MTLDRLSGKWDPAYMDMDRTFKTLKIVLENFKEIILVTNLKGNSEWKVRVLENFPQAIIRNMNFSPKSKHYSYLDRYVGPISWRYLRTKGVLCKDICNAIYQYNIYVKQLKLLHGDFPKWKWGLYSYEYAVKLLHHMGELYELAKNTIHERGGQ